MTDTFTVFNSNFYIIKTVLCLEKQTFRDEISEILSGQKILLFADVMESDHDKEAMKFDFIFKSVNKSKSVG
jgi:hypothetical protein